MFKVLNLIQMKISHEVPLNYLEASLEFNDYQYILPCMMDKYPEYKEFMLNYRNQPNSFIICDNDLFEGVSRNDNELIEIVNQIKPDIFIIPDEWNDSGTCYKKAKYWINTISNQLPKETNLMAVLQGETYEEIKLLYSNYIDLGIKHIAFNHSSKAYLDYFPHKNVFISKTYGRVGIINKLLDKGIIKTNLYHHLLGINLIDELKCYKHSDYDFIKSIDTSNPIILGYDKKSYEWDNIDYKPKTPIGDIMEKDMVNIFITKNIMYFKDILKK
jgi:hypothetical protein